MGTLSKTTLIPMIVFAVVFGVIGKIMQSIQLAPFLYALAVIALIVVGLFILHAAEVPLPKPIARVMDRVAGKDGAHSKMLGVTAEMVGERMAEKLFGQADLIDAIATALRPKLVQKRHDGAFLSLIVGGPRGTGRSVAARALAYGLYGAEKEIVEIDVAKDGPKAALAALNGVATRAVTDNELVIAFDKTEAGMGDPDFVKALEALVEEGRIGGKKVASRMVVFISTDAAHDTIARAAEDKSGKALVAAVVDAFGSAIPSSLIKAVDLVTATRPLDNASRATVAYHALKRVVSGNFDIEAADIEPMVLLHCAKTWEDLGSDGTKNAARWMYAKAQHALGEALAQNAATAKLTWDESGDEGTGAIAATILTYKADQTGAGGVASASTTAPRTGAPISQTATLHAPVERRPLA